MQQCSWLARYKLSVEQRHANGPDTAITADYIEGRQCNRCND